MKTPLILLLILSTPFIRVWAQVTLTGTIQDGAGKPLPFASVAWLNARDSSIGISGLPGTILLNWVYRISQSSLP